MRNIQHMTSIKFLSARARLSPRSILILFALLVTLAPVRAETELSLDPKSSSLKFVGESFMHDFHGEAKQFSGSAQWDPAAKPPIQKAVLHIKTASLTTFHEERDKKMDDWLNIKVHPNALLSG